MSILLLLLLTSRIFVDVKMCESHFVIMSAREREKVVKKLL